MEDSKISNGTISIRNLPKRLQERLEVALTHKREEDYEVAIEILLEIAPECPSTPSVFGLLGGCYSMLGRFEEAAKYYKNATALNPTSELAARGLFNSLWNAGAVDEAIAELERYVSITKSEEFEQLLRDAKALVVRGGNS